VLPTLHVLHDFHLAPTAVNGRQGAVEPCNEAEFRVGEWVGLTVSQIARDA